MDSRDSIERAVLLKDERFGDSFGREHAVSTLLRTMHRLPPPGCIALYGSWGSGKTTLLAQTRNEWQKQGNRAVWFDPWEHERRPGLLAPLLSTLVRGVQDGVDVEAMKRLALGVAKTLAALSVQVGAQYAFGDVARPFDVLKDVKAKDITEHFERVSKEHDEIETAKSTFKQLVEKLLAAHAKKRGTKLEDDERLAIFLDDVDRCLPENVVLLLEGVKLLLCGQEECPVVFVFALDRHVVGEAIAARYPGATAYTGESYLEKIFDASLEVPPLEPKAVGDFIVGRTGSLGAPMGELLAVLGGAHMVAETLGDPAFGNPRVIKRVINRLLLFATHPGGTIALDALLARAAGEQARSAECRRVTAWIAGIERFRAFRAAFADASSEELATLHERLSGKDRPGGLGRFAKIADTPAFGRYYDLLGLRSLDPGQIDRQRRPGDPRGRATLRDYDDLLRRSAL